MEKHDMEHILNILTRAEKAERIGIVLGSASGDAELLAAHALKDRLGDKTFILNAPEHLQDRWSSMFKKERPQQELALTLDIGAHPVDELRYEKDGGKLRIFLSSPTSAVSERNGPELTKDAFEMEQRHVPSDMIVALGFSDETNLEELIETSTPLKNKEALVNLSPVPQTLSLASTPEQPALSPQWDINAVKLWSRAMLRSSVEKEEGIFWAFLPKEDFQKTEQSDDILPALVIGMRQIINLPPLCIVFWQDQENTSDNVHVLISGTNTVTMDRLSTATNTPLADDTLIIRAFQNFSEAEIAVRKLLKTV